MAEQVGVVRARLFEALAEGGLMTTSEVTSVLQRAGVDVDSGRVHALLTSEALRGTVTAGTRDVAGIARVAVWRLAARPVLCWEKPEKAESYEAWARYQAECAPPGTYVPNMSDAWKARWKARMLGQRSGDLRVEVRKSTGIYRGGSVQVKLVAGDDGTVTMSMNGTAELTRQEFTELGAAVAEARAAMEAWRAGQSCQALPEGVKATAEGDGDR